MTNTNNIIERFNSLFHDVAKIWNAWNIQLFVLLSLSLQVCLVLIASYRKRAAKKWVVTFISLAYFLADWATPYALGLISNRQRINIGTAHNLYAFWAPFLLFHLSGPDNISSISLDENEVSLKQWVQVVAQFVAILFILQRASRSFPFIIQPAILVFLAGLLKYAERIWARHLASPNNWINSIQQMERNPRPDYEKLSVAYMEMREAHLPVEVQSLQIPPKKFKASFESDHLPNVGHEEAGHLDDKSLLKFAHFFYKTFKGFMGGTSFNLEQRQISRNFFLKISERDAFKILEMELSIVHDALHTKAVVARRKIGSVLRVISACSIVVASFLFFLYDKSGFLKVDVIFTYVLILGTIVLEILSFLMLLLSDWYLIAHKHYNWKERIATAIVNRHRWSEFVSKFNIVSYCLHKHPRVNRKIPGAQLIMNLLAASRIRQTTTTYVAPKSVRYKIFEEMKKKSEVAENVETATMICSQRGDWALMQSSCYNQFKWSLGEIEYGKSLVLWHIAADLCFYVCRSSHDNPDDVHERGFCKTISDYMLYLLVMKPTMMVPVAGHCPQITQDTTAEAKRLLSTRSVRDHGEACLTIFSVATEFRRAVLRTDASNSVLFDACRLARQLMEREEPWKLMSKVWVDLLGYAAVNCEAHVHAQQLSRGGELLTFVWLMMNHLGLGMQFRDEPARTRYKLVVKK
ncbi:uncharacterized protein LOC114295181 [Camellia sinensis]|uniref:DUF4220 domain-containing protein n=1 Tax=Camellia sinensis var. sinensis TaxID=542762 RepID=A0A4V3WKM8_CAMSN|nr:uncharacterized protein LOC114295181 [Camellia sinensis]THG01497.1 hypothetical protein TEA_022288 [Camellia sinensis var. sinensis]